MKPKLLAVAVGLAFLAVPASGEATTYLLSTAPFATGFIETDGTLGQLAASNIIDWDVISARALEFTPANSVVRVGGVPGVVATQDGLFVDFTPFVGLLRFSSTAIVPDGPFAEMCFCTAVETAQHSIL